MQKQNSTSVRIGKDTAGYDTEFFMKFDQGQETATAFVQSERLWQSLISKLCEKVEENQRLIRENSELKKEAQSDPLTGVLNRRGFEFQMDVECARFMRYNEPFVLLMFDLDNFKEINDTCGHSAGDEILRQTAELIRKRLRPMDTVARLGGDEFVVLLSRCDEKSGKFVADEICRRIEEHRFYHEDVKIPVTVSCGFAQFISGNTPDKLFNRADKALYQAKAAGRNRSASLSEITSAMKQ